MNDSARRVLRTAIQFVTGAGFTAFVDQILVDIPDRYDAYVIVAAGVVVSFFQNLAEDYGFTALSPVNREPSE